MPVVQVIKAGWEIPVVRQVAFNLAGRLINEVGVPVAKHGASKLYKGVTRGKWRKQRVSNER